jgi:hypothetical protein
MKLLKIKCFFYLAALIMLVCQTAQAQTNTSPKAKTLAPKSKTLIIETVAPYVIFEYSPPFEIIDLASGKLPSFSHPELAIQAYFSAIRSLNYEEYLNCWTKNSQAVMRDNDSKIKYDAAKWKAIWADVFVGKNIQISHWINYGSFVLIGFHLARTLKRQKLQSPLR